MLKKHHIALLRTLLDVFLKKKVKQKQKASKTAIRCLDNVGIEVRLSDLDLEYVSRPGKCALAQGHIELTIVDKELSQNAKVRAEEVRLLICDKFTTLDPNVIVTIMTIQNKTEQSAYFVEFVLSTDCLNKSQE